MTSWRAQGKQVLQDGRHFADAAGELEDMMIVNALRNLDEGLSDTPRIGNAVRQRRCVPERQGDEIAYTCGRRRGFHDSEPIGCADCGR